VIALKPSMDTISIWNKNASNLDNVKIIREDIENIVKIEEGMKIEYEVFYDVVKKNEENANNNNEQQ